MESAPQDSHEANASYEPESTYEILNSPELRAEYITYTDGLISRLAENKTDLAIYLDKSARPVAWLVNELWDILAPRDPKTGQAIAKPEIKFLNIDREQWGPFVGRSEDETGGININRIPEQSIDGLKEVFAPVAGRSRPGDISLLTNKRVMVVDEVRSSGDTLHMSEEIIKRAFPDATSIDGVYWMPKPAERDPKSGMLVSGAVPIWYSDETNLGRLVANRDASKSRQSNSSRQRAGAMWLSTLFRKGPDEAGRQLKREAKQLAEDLRQRKITYFHSPLWNSELEPIEDRIRRIDDLSVEEYARRRQAAHAHAGHVALSGNGLY